MAEAERRPGKTPLLKQPEIEMEEEERSQAEDKAYVNNNTNAYNASNKSPAATAAEGGGESPDLGTSVPPADSNGADAVPPTSQPSSQPENSPSPETPAGERSLKLNHSISSKTKQLMRSSAICDYDSVPTTPVLPEVKVTTTPAPDNEDSVCEYVSHPPLLGQDGSLRRSTLQKNGSLSSDAGTSNCSLSRESSIEKSLYKDSSGCDLEEFIKKTLVKSKKDKQMLLNLERDFKIFVESPDQHYQLAEMSSYDRMICHRVAAFYGMEHNIDKSGKCVIVSKTKITRIPTFNCEEYVKTVEPADEAGSEKKQMRLLKKPASMEERSRGGDKTQFSGHRTKSLEERQKTYEEKRKMIFGASSEDCPTYPVIESVSGACKRLNSREWSSTDSSGYVSEDGSRLRRSVMAKSNSYGDSITSYECGPVRNKLASPENSQSPISGSRSSSADVNSPNHGFGGTGPPYTVLVAPDINAIPPGSMVVNPHTLQPHTNADGTTYRFNPNDPSSVPPWLVGSVPAHTQHQQATAANITFTPAPSVHQVQYTQNNDLCNRFSAMEVATPMEASMEGQQMMTLSQHPHQPQHATHQPHLQQPAQIPLMVSTALQPSQQYVPTYTGTAQAPGFYTGAQLQFVPVDAQGQCLSIATATNPQPGMVTYGQPQLVQTASGLQPGMMTDQTGLTTVNPYGQGIYTAGGAVTDSVNASSVGVGGGGGCYIPYVPNNSVLYQSVHYPGGGNAVPGAAPQTASMATHYSAYNPPQSSSPQQQQHQQQQQQQQQQMAQFAPMAVGAAAQVRPTTPPSLPIAQPVGYHHHHHHHHSQQQQQQGQAGGGGGGGMVGAAAGGAGGMGVVSSPPQFQHVGGGAYYTAPPHHPFQGQPPAAAMGQVVQMTVRPQSGGGGATTATAGISVGGSHVPHHPHHQPHPHHPPHQTAAGPPTLQHSQSYPMLRTIPTSIGSAPTANPVPSLGMGSAHMTGLSSTTPNGNPAPNPQAHHPHHHHSQQQQQQQQQQQHPIMVKSLSLGAGSMRANGGAATPDKDSTPPGLVGGTSAFLPGFGQATAVQFPAGPFVTQGVRQPQPGDLRIMGASSIRSQMTPSLIAFQPGQPVRNSRPSGLRQSRPPKRNHSNAGNSNLPTTTASASVARVMSLDSGSASQQVLNRQ